MTLSSRLWEAGQPFSKRHLQPLQQQRDMVLGSPEVLHQLLLAGHGPSH